MPRRRTDKQVISSKTDVSSGETGSMPYKSPSSRRYLVKNSDSVVTSDEEKIEEDLLRELIHEIVRKCGNDWCLYTKKKDSSGRRRRLGTHSSKAAAHRQERAIKSSGG